MLGLGLGLAACGGSSGPILVTPWRTWPSQWSGDVLVLDTIEATEKLTLAPCTTVFLGRDAVLRIGDSIEARGTPDCPVVFTTRQEVGRFGGLHFETTARSPSLLENVLFEGGSGAYTPSAEDPDASGSVLSFDAKTPVTLRGVSFTGTAAHGLEVTVNEVAGVDGGTGAPTFEGPLRFERTHYQVLRAPMALAHRLPDIVSQDLAEAPEVRLYGEMPLLGAPTRWSTRGAALRLESHLEVNGDVLELGPGVTLRMPSVWGNPALTVGPSGRLAALGTPEARVTLTSRYVPADRVHPRELYWDAVTLSSPGNVLRDTVLRLGGGEYLDLGVVRVRPDAGVRLERVEFRESRGCDVHRADPSSTVEAVETSYTPCVP